MAEVAAPSPPPTTAPPAASVPSNGEPRRHHPVVCHGHTRPVTHLCFSTMKSGNYHIVSSSKDCIPILREGRTGDWLGSWIGHQGAIWCARQSADWSKAVSASADFTARVWDASTGELLFTLTHKHMVRAVDFCPSSNDAIVTASNDGVLRLWVTMKIGTPTPETPEGVRTPLEGHWASGYGEYVWVVGNHKPNAAMKFAVWLGYPQRAPPSLSNTSGAIVTAQGKTLYWWDLAKISHDCENQEAEMKQHTFDDDITCCEKYMLDLDYTEPGTDIGGGLQVLGVAAGKKATFWGGANCTNLLREFNMEWPVSSVAIDVKNHKVLMGQAESTWAVMVDWETGTEEQVFKSHHGPIHSVSFSPDNKIFVTGSEDGTVRLWKNCEGDYGLWKTKTTD